MPRLLERYTETIARRFNIAPDGEGDVTVDGERRGLRWGLLAPWRGHGGVRPPPICTARLDALARTPVLARAHRCLVHADGWYAKAKIGKATHAWWIHGATTFAGVSATHRDDGVAAFAILLVPAPVELARFCAWLPAGGWNERGEATQVAWRAVEVSRYFEDLAHDDERCIAPIGNPNQGELF